MVHAPRFNIFSKIFSKLKFNSFQIFFFKTQTRLQLLHEQKLKYKHFLLKESFFKFSRNQKNELNNYLNRLTKCQMLCFLVSLRHKKHVNQQFSIILCTYFTSAHKLYDCRTKWSLLCKKNGRIKKFHWISIKVPKKTCQKTRTTNAWSRWKPISNFWFLTKPVFFIKLMKHRRYYQLIVLLSSRIKLILIEISRKTYAFRPWGSALPNLTILKAKTLLHIYWYSITNLELLSKIKVDQ